MSLSGVIVKRDGASGARGELWVRETYNHHEEPLKVSLYWKIIRAAGSSWNAMRPDEGDIATYDRSGGWTTRRPDGAQYDAGRSSGHVWTGDGSEKAQVVEKEPLPPPKVRRGVEVRYRDGGWQKLLKKGWVPA